MSDGDGKVVYPSKFKQIADKVKGRLGVKHEPEMYLDSASLMRAFQQTEIWGVFARMYPDHNMMRWKFDVRDGEVIGVTFTQFQKEAQ